MVIHRGGCHCGRVRFEVEAPAVIEATLCNCSICSMTAYLPDGISVNVRCLDPATIESVRVTTFDGRNWEANAGELAHLSSEMEGKGG